MFNPQDWKKNTSNPVWEAMFRPFWRTDGQRNGQRNARTHACTHARTDKNQKRQKHPKPHNPIKRVLDKKVWRPWTDGADKAKT